MGAAQLIREARRRAQLSQSELARRLGTAQSVVARWERGGASPSLETLRRVLRACGFELEVHLVPADEGVEHDWVLALQNLRLTPEQRLRQVEELVSFTEEGRRAVARAKSVGA